jgi:hypothetical protein
LSGVLCVLCIVCVCVYVCVCHSILSSGVFVDVELDNHPGNKIGSEGMKHSLHLHGYRKKRTDTEQRSNSFCTTAVFCAETLFSKIFIGIVRGLNLPVLEVLLRLSLLCGVEGAPYLPDQVPLELRERIHHVRFRRRCELNGAVAASSPLQVPRKLVCASDWQMVGRGCRS